MGLVPERGCHCVASALGLNYASLRERVGGAGVRTRGARAAGGKRRDDRAESTATATAFAENSARTSRPAVLLREGWRDQGKVRKRTLANLSDWPAARVAALRAVLTGDLRGRAAPVPAEAVDIVRTRPHGHVVAALGTLRRLGLDALIAARHSPERARVLGMIVARILEPGSKLATARGLREETLSSTLGELLGLDVCSEDELYEAMDWLLPRQEKIEAALAKRHLGAHTWRSTMSPRPTSRAGAVRWRAAGTAGTANATSCRSSSAC